MYTTRTTENKSFFLHLFFTTVVEMLHENQRRFNRSTKRKLKEAASFTCQECNQRFKPEDLEIHHHYIWDCEAKHLQIPGSFVACKENGKVLCPSCHVRLHKDIQLRPTHVVIQAVLALSHLKGDIERGREVVNRIRKRSQQRFFYEQAPIRRR